ncbi:MAG: ComEC/Rec2 family competence protein [Aureibaculum sp.]|nr:ComEC/Rec2 family competence protein [Aureibaculum sp.]
MKLLKYILLQLIIFQIIGIIFGLYCSFTIKTSTIALLITLFLLVVTYFLSRKKLKQHRYFTISTFITFIVIGIASITFNKSIQNKNHYSSYLSETNNTSILIIDEILKPNSYNNRYFANVTTVNSIKVQGKILLNILKDSANNTINVDGKIFISHGFDPIKAPLNPYQFNYKEYLENQQIHHQISTKNKGYLLLKTIINQLKAGHFQLENELIMR